MSAAPLPDEPDYDSDVDQATLLAAWASAEELSSFILQRLEGTPHNKAKLSEIRRMERRAAKPESGYGLANYNAVQASALRLHYEKDRRLDVEKQLRGELAAGAHDLIARLSGDETNRLHRVLPGFWPGARFCWTPDQVERGKTRFVDAKVVKGGLVSIAPKALAIVHQPSAPEKSDEPDTMTKPPAAKRTKPATYPTFRSKVLELRSDPDFMGLATREDQARHARAEILGPGFKKKDDTAGYKTGTLVKWLGEILGGDTPE